MPLPAAVVGVPATLVIPAAGVCVPVADDELDELLEELLEEPPVAGTLLVEPVKVKACQGTKTWLLEPVLALEPEPVPAAGVCVVFAVAAVVAAGVELVLELLLELPLEDEFDEEPPVTLTTT